MKNTYRDTTPHNCLSLEDRRGSILALAIGVLVLAFVFAAFTVDVGMIGLTKSQLQNAADAAVTAAAMELVDSDRLRGGAWEDGVFLAARNEANDYATEHLAAGVAPALNLNLSNHPDGDIVFGQLNSNGQISSLGNSQRYNAVRVRARRENGQNGDLSFSFARLIGHDSTGVIAEATATFSGGVTGFDDSKPFTSLVPFGIDYQEWQNLMSNHGPDSWTWDNDTDVRSSGPDGVRELVLYEGDNVSPGNFGSLTIGDPNNGNEEIQNQIRDGVSQADLSHYGGELKLNSSGTLNLNGDTGSPTGHLRAAADILGKPVTMPLYTTVAGSGSGSVFTIVGFVGVRIIDVRENGTNKGFTIQPSYVVDETTITGSNNNSWFVYGPVKVVQ